MTLSDPIEFEVFRHQLDAIADEMGVSLSRAAYSTNIKTRADFSCAVFDADCQMLSQSFSIPIHLGSLTHYVPRIVEIYGRERIRDGDVIMCNDGHLGGVHLNDVVLIAPVFNDERIVAIVAALAHQVDVGGTHPGSVGLTRSVFEEGIMIPPTLLRTSEGIDNNVLGLILNNVRSPRECGGDMRAQVAACVTGLNSLGELIDTISPSRFQELGEELLEYTEQRVRKEIALLPNGRYVETGQMDGNGFDDDPVTVRVAVTIDEDRVLFDLRGSDPQQPGPINATYAMSLSNCAYVLRALISPDLPTNDGFYRAVELITDPGTVVDARRPAPISGGWETGFRVCETAFRALSQVIPERLAAGSKGCLANIMFGGIDPSSGETFTFFESLAGGYGARSSMDGLDAIQPHVQNSENSPIEEMEAGYPVRVLRFELVENSEGAGQFRGGLGLRRDYSFTNGATFGVLADRAKEGGWPIGEGLWSPPAEYVLNPGTMEEKRLGSKFSVRLEPQDVMRVQMTGGGGFGSPLSREPGRVLDDVLDGRVSPERAESVYGVVLKWKEATAPIVDEAETARRRSETEPSHVEAAHN